MRTRLVRIGAIALAALVALAAILPVAAEGPVSTPDTGDEEALAGILGEGAARPGFWAAYDAAAEALGLTPAELFEGLHAGRTLAEIAEAQDVDLDDVREAMAAARQEVAREVIETAVEEGRLEEDHGGWLLEGLENGWLGRVGRGIARHVARLATVRP